MSDPTSTRDSIRRPMRIIWAVAITAIVALLVGRFWHGGWGGDAGHKQGQSRAAPGEGMSDGQPPSNARAGHIWVSPRDGKEMVYVPSGEFVMGSREGEVHVEGADDDECPQRRVHLDGFWMDKCEVTVGEYWQFCQATGREMPDAPRWGWEDTHPMVNVSWHDAAAYAAWAGKRLPTEAEWEKAARGTDGRKYPWGDEGPWVSRCNFHGTRDGHEYTAPVGSYPQGASPYGCLDMAGNVWEWCADWHDRDYYRTGPTRNPKGPSSGSLRMSRGGGWNAFVRALRCAYRGSSGPESRSNGKGFRCARDGP